VEGRKYRRNERAIDRDRRSLARSLKNIAEFRKSRARAWVKRENPRSRSRAKLCHQMAIRGRKNESQVKMVLWGRRYYLNKINIFYMI
jgi:hypothetical protein